MSVVYRTGSGGGRPFLSFSFLFIFFIFIIVIVDVFILVILSIRTFLNLDSGLGFLF